LLDGFTVEERARFYRAALDQALAEADGAKTEEDQERWLELAAQQCQLLEEAERLMRERRARKLLLSDLERELLRLRRSQSG
jgi:hypothetical protein